ncbi:chemotaxis protein CheA [Bradyrhizobium aeschynomenes]|uniref:chemotaxis protein CheA n=1 Tax=Bradyrhizobium aeschynomenes TaxID=2734909 RepID=UPI0015554033|nr:chemotaxis protein CheA [Bradyrhizobium aeschynomenes]NPV22039.1 chemotaxis protein CheA [Bradyrhizobium aeschynomenes]
MNEFMEQFLLESRELVAQAIDDLLALGQNPADRDRLNGALRAFHTLKGGAGIVDFAAMARLLHAAEDVLAAGRSSEASIPPDVLDACLACLDLTSRWLDAMQARGETPIGAELDANDMIARLHASRDDDEHAQASLPEADDWLDRLDASALEAIGRPRTALRYVPDQDAFFQAHDPLAFVAALPNVISIDACLTGSAAALEIMNPFSCHLDLVVVMAASGEDVRAAAAGALGVTEIRELDPPGGVAVTTVLGEHSAAPAVEAIERSLMTTDPASVQAGLPLPAHSPAALRVAMSRIDTLVKLTGELIVLKNALGHSARLSQNDTTSGALAASLRQQHAQFERLATELQTAVLRIRVLPLRSVFRRFPKLVKEISASVGKSVRLVSEGDDTEADAMIVEALFEPLLHILRNAIDHGIEDPHSREAAGKPAMGTVVLRARRDADSVVVDVRDDGGGVDVARVRAVAAERQIAGPGVLAAMADAEAANLIFLPGFSTASAITELSGRGVGMDTVKTNIERLGGRVVLETRDRVGTCISLVLPFSLMKTAIMTVEVAGQVCGLPLDTIVETTSVHRDRVIQIGSGHAVVLRNRTLPLIDLAHALGFRQERSASTEARIVVMSVETQMAGLEVDRLGERMDVMLTPMDGLLAGVRGIAGTSLLGDGRVLIVLNAEELLG